MISKDNTDLFSDITESNYVYQLICVLGLH